MFNIAAPPIVSVAATPIVPVATTSIVPVAATPIVPELCFVLRNVMDWEKIVVQLPKMSAIDVDKIQMSGDLNSRKEEAFDTWLRRYPEATWSHVRDALHKAGEFILEREIAEKYGLPLLAENSIPTREVLTSQATFTTNGTIGGRQPNIGPQYPVLLAPLPSEIIENLTFFFS